MAPLVDRGVEAQAEQVWIALQQACARGADRTTFRAADARSMNPMVRATLELWGYVIEEEEEGGRRGGASAAAVGGGFFSLVGVPHGAPKTYNIRAW